MKKTSTGITSTACYVNLRRGGSRTVATSKMKRFVIIVNGWKPLTIITKRSILDVAAVLDPPLLRLAKMGIVYIHTFQKFHSQRN